MLDRLLRAATSNKSLAPPLGRKEVSSQSLRAPPRATPHEISGDSSSPLVEFIRRQHIFGVEERYALVTPLSALSDYFLLKWSSRGYG